MAGKGPIYGHIAIRDIDRDFLARYGELLLRHGT